MSYQSPISIIYQDMMHKLNESLEQNVCTAIQRYGIEVDKDELIKALQYDRQQYDKGYSDAMMSAVKVVRCKDCKWFRDSNGIDGFCYCDRIYRRCGTHWFCADGERRENDGDSC